MAEEKQETNTRYRDWTKACLALKYLREGIIKLVDGTVKMQHERMLSDIERQYGPKATGCNNCNIRTLLPVHTTAQNGKCPYGQKFCNCLNPNQKKLCPTMFCSAMYDQIMAQHRYNSPNWKNTDIRHWHDNHWEIAKCNISDGYRSKHSAQDTDTSGLLHVLINDLEMQNQLDQVVDPPEDIFSKVRKVRDTIFHSANQELDETSTKAYIDDMIAILNDKKNLVKAEDAKTAKQKLLQLKENKYVITTQDEMEMREEALAEINRKREESLQAIKDKQENVISLLQTYEQNAIMQQLQKQQTEDKLREEMDKFFNQTKTSTNNAELKLKEIENKQVLLEKAVQSQSENQGKITQLEMELSDIKSSYHLQDSHKQRLQHLNKQALKNILIEIYEKYHTKTSVLPMMPEEQVDVSEVYVTPQMFTKDLRVNSYRDIFFNENNKKNAKIYVTGDAGIGKSTFCKQMIKKWCTAQSNRETNEECKTDKEVDDLQILKDFEFLFFISLQHESENTSILDMIKHQLLEGEDDSMLGVVDDLMLRESEKCLIILDGLDEWNPRVKASHAFQNSNIPFLRARSKCTVITTSRPWKMISALLRPTDVDFEFKIEGLYNSKKFVQSVVAYLNEKHEDTKEYQTFIHSIFWDTRLSAARDIPVMLLQHICLWFDGKPVGDSLCETYSNMIDLFLQRCPENILFSNQQVPISLPACMQTTAKSQKCKHVLLALSRLAFETLFPTDGQSCVTFERSTALGAGMEENDLELCLKIGILTESKIVGKSVSKRLSRISFVHKTFQEFFSALYLYNDNTESDMTETGGSSKANTDRIAPICNTIPKILEMGNTFIFISGMKPSIATKLSEHIGHIVDESTEIQTYRESLANERCVIHIQKLITDCVNEMANKGQMNSEEQLHLRDLYLDDVSHWQCLQNIDTNTVKSIVIRTWTNQTLLVQKLQNCKYLQKLTVITTEPEPSNGLVMQLLLNSIDTLINLQLGAAYERNLPENQLLYKQPVVSVLCGMSKLRTVQLQNQNLTHEYIEELFSHLAINTTLRELSLTDLRCAVHPDSCLLELLLNSYNLKVVKLSNLKFKTSFSDAINGEDPKLESILFNQLQPQAERVLLQTLAQMASAGAKIESLTCSVCERTSRSSSDQLSVQTLVDTIPTLHFLKQLEISDTDFGDNDFNIGTNTELQYVRLLDCPMTDKSIKSVLKKIENLKHSVTLYFGKCKIYRKEQGDIIEEKILSWKYEKTGMKVHHLVYHHGDNYIEGLFQWEPEQNV